MATRGLRGSEIYVIQESDTTVICTYKLWIVTFYVDMVLGFDFRRWSICGAMAKSPIESEQQEQQSQNPPELEAPLLQESTAEEEYSSSLSTLRAKMAQGLIWHKVAAVSGTYIVWSLMAYSLAIWCQLVWLYIHFGNVRMW